MRPPSQNNEQTRLRFVITLISFVVLCLIKCSEQLLDSRISGKSNIENICSSIKTCHSCKKAYQCEWCHDTGCTSFPRLYCPKRLFLENLWRRKSNERYCTEIVNSHPIFVPANVRRFINLELKIDDLTLYQRNIICEIRIDYKIIQVTATFDENTVYCDVMILKTSRNVSLGSLKLIWGGAEPHSNVILLIVYNCQTLALNCEQCLRLNKDFQCGWCEEKSSCSLIEECPRQYGLWMNKSVPCDNSKLQRNAQMKYWGK
ncbi:plexin A3-like [Achroia grisella]|uniref:plexin A3-like n=1 Tax=Achroia grisella TaxID=688607 RepID=UPI0027D30F7C|nr:plexin A3-like [Achroia grisella]